MGASQRKPPKRGQLARGPAAPTTEGDTRPAGVERARGESEGDQQGGESEKGVLGGQPRERERRGPARGERARERKGGARRRERHAGIKFPARPTRQPRFPTPVPNQPRQTRCSPVNVGHRTACVARGAAWRAAAGGTNRRNGTSEFVQSTTALAAGGKIRTEGVGGTLPANILQFSTLQLSCYASSQECMRVME